MLYDATYLSCEITVVSVVSISCNYFWESSMISDEQTNQFSLQFAEREHWIRSKHGVRLHLTPDTDSVSFWTMLIVQCFSIRIYLY
jgi:hypothetical protein